MSRGSRRLNYTGRKRIIRKHVSITIHDSGNGHVPTFDASLDLDSYPLAGSARVFVEAYRQTAFQRFDFGSVGALEPPENRQLDEFGAAEGVLFRVKVVESHADGAGIEANVAASSRPARILAQADQLRPDHAGKHRSLLHLEPWDSRDEVWRLDIDEDTGPLLKISRHLAPDRHSLVRSSQFVALALPELLRASSRMHWRRVFRTLRRTKTRGSGSGCVWLVN